MTDHGQSSTLKILMFALGSRRQKFALEVDQVRELIKCPSLSSVPYSPAGVLGMAYVRNKPLSVIDLALCVGLAGGFSAADIDSEKPPLAIVHEQEGRAIAMLVQSVDSIMDCPRERIQEPPRELTGARSLKGVIEVDGELVNLLDINNVLAGMQIVADEAA